MACEVFWEALHLSSRRTGTSATTSGGPPRLAGSTSARPGQETRRSAALDFQLESASKGTQPTVKRTVMNAVTTSRITNTIDRMLYMVYTCAAQLNFRQPGQYWVLRES